MAYLLKKIDDRGDRWENCYNMCLCEGRKAWDLVYKQVDWPQIGAWRAKLRESRICGPQILAVVRLWKHSLLLWLSVKQEIESSTKRQDRGGDVGGLRTERQGLLFQESRWADGPGRYVAREPEPHFQVHSFEPVSITVFFSCHVLPYGVVFILTIASYFLKM